MGQRYTFLDYDGLQRYDQDWLDEFERMALTEEEIDNILKDLNIFPQTIFSFLVNTEANDVYDGYTTGIPFNLYGYQDDIKLKVDWGDGSTDLLANYKYSSTSVEASIHTYAKPGKYIVSVSSNNWSDIYINVSNSSSSSMPQHIKFWRMTLVKILTPIPHIKGTSTKNDFSYLFYGCPFLKEIPSNLFINNPNISSFNNCFGLCASLKAIPENLFASNINATNFSNCFAGCRNIVAIPENLFASNINATNFSNCFYNAWRVRTSNYSSTYHDRENDELANFSIKIGSSIVSNADAFVFSKSNTSRIVYVPNNSTTKTTFQNIASTYGLTVNTL